MTAMIQRPTMRQVIETKLAVVNASAKRIPRHWTDSKAAIHAKLDALLDEWEEAE